ncbi:MAG TPA: 30S ribosomal protein S16, partial [Bacteroidales bacterium]|nr:30S ribosomal protein S16 [Bacteroidales bacterium]
QTWLDQKEGKIQAKRDSLQKGAELDAKQRLEAEAKIREARAEEIAKKNAEAAAAEAKQEAAAEETAEEQAPEAENTEEAPQA